MMMAVDFEHPFVGRVAVYRDPYRAGPEQGPIMSVNVEANLVFVRYGHGSTSAATECNDRLTFLDGSPVRLATDVCSRRTKAYDRETFEREFLDGPDEAPEEPA